MTNSLPIHREVRSFVRREGRITPAQKLALEKFWPRYGIDMPPPAPSPAERGREESESTSPVATGEEMHKNTLPRLRGRVGEGAFLDFIKLFGRDAARVLEIGFGNGESMQAQALAHPELDYIGIEVHRPGVGRLLSRLAAQDIRNVRVICADAVEVLDKAIPPGSLDCVELYFPDPWPKKRHHKRRIVQPVFADRIARVLRAGGRWLLATDWAPYAEQMREVLNAHPDFANLAPDGKFVPRPPERLLTKFEQRGLKLGHAVFDLAFRRV